jgi:hypothetical protein
MTSSTPPGGEEGSAAPNGVTRLRGLLDRRYSGTAGRSRVGASCFSPEQHSDERPTGSRSVLL